MTKENGAEGDLVLPGVRVSGQDLQGKVFPVQRLLKELLKAWACRLYQAGVEKPDFGELSEAFEGAWSGLQFCENAGYPFPWDDKETAERKTALIPKIGDPEWAAHWQKIAEDVEGL